MRMSLIRNLAWVVALTGTLLFAQKPPQPKSQKEQQAVMAIFNEKDPVKRIALVETLLTNYADTEFKVLALQVAADAAQQANDYEKMVVYSERTLEADPKNVGALLMLSHGLAQRTKEFDLDKEEKLTRADKLAKNALELIPTAPKPNPQIPDEQWAEAKKEMTAQAHETLGMSAQIRKKYDVAVTEYKESIDSAPQADQATLVRLADVYVMAGKPDESLATLTKIYAIPNLDPRVKAVADNVKAKADKVKSGQLKVPNPNANPNAPAQVEVTK